MSTCSLGCCMLSTESTLLLELAAYQAQIYLVHLGLQHTMHISILSSWACMPCEHSRPITRCKCMGGWTMLLLSSGAASVTRPDAQIMASGMLSGIRAWMMHLKQSSGRFPGESLHLPAPRSRCAMRLPSRVLEPLFASAKRKSVASLAATSLRERHA